MVPSRGSGFTVRLPFLAPPHEAVRAIAGSNTGIETQARVDELSAMSPDQLLTFVRLLRDGQTFAETCVHEAAHAVIALRLNVPFDYVTVQPEPKESGEISAVGHG